MSGQPNKIMQCAAWALRMLSTMLLFWEAGTWELTAVDSARSEAFLLLVMLSTYCLTFFAFALLGVCGSKKLSNVFLATSSLVSQLVAVAFSFSLQGIPNTEVASFALIGFGQATTFVVWQRIFSDGNVFESGKAIMLASIISAFLFLILTLLASGIPRLNFVLLSSVASNAVTIFAVKSAKHNDCYARVSGKLGFLLSRLWRSILCVSLFGFVWELITSLALIDSSAQREFGHALSLTQLIGMIALLVCWVKWHDKMVLTDVYQVLFPLMATGFLLMPFLGGVYTIALMLCSCIAFGVVSVFMQITCIQEHKESGVDPMVILGFFAGPVYLFMVAGYVVGHFAIDAEGGIGTSQLLVVAMSVVYAFSLVFFTVKVKTKRLASSVAQSETSSLDERCSALAHAHGLTKREAEVLILLAKGRDLPYISEELFISKNTVRTHMKGIYRKLGIHSKQELLDLFDDDN